MRFRLPLLTSNTRHVLNRITAATIASTHAKTPPTTAGMEISPERGAAVLTGAVHAGAHTHAPIAQKAQEGARDTESHERTPYEWPLGNERRIRPSCRWSALPRSARESVWVLYGHLRVLTGSQRVIRVGYSHRTAGGRRCRGRRRSLRDWRARVARVRRLRRWCRGESRRHASHRTYRYVRAS